MRVPLSSVITEKSLFGLPNRITSGITRLLNPNATQADVGETMQAYYDKERKVWVFPGEDPAELAKPIGPPPTAPVVVAPLADAPSTPGAVDPLAALMAPPMRGVPSSLRSAPMKKQVLSPPPQFAVFQPKPTPESGKSEKESEDD
jgi:hypothetical protein